MSSLFFLRPPKTRFNLDPAPPEDVGKVGDGGGGAANSVGDRDCTWPIAGTREEERGTGRMVSGGRGHLGAVKVDGRATISEWLESDEGAAGVLEEVDDVEDNEAEDVDRCTPPASPCWRVSCLRKGMGCVVSDRKG
jgi:hypothetical protein